MVDFFPRLSSTEYMTLVPYILYTVVSRFRPGGVGSLFCTLVHNSDLDLMSHSMFIFSRIGRSSIKQFLS